MTTKTRIFSIIGLTLLISGIIYFLVYSSTDPHLGGDYWEQWVVRHFHYTPGYAHELVFAVRKTMHFMGYGTLGLLFWLYFYLWGFKKAWGFGIVATALVASCDEYLQTLTNFRSGRVEDVLLDVSGALIAYGLVALWRQRKNRHEA